MNDVTIVITSINPANSVMEAIAKGAIKADWNFIVIGDTKSPNYFKIPGCQFFSIANQLALNFAFAKACPTGHYARKNIGYLQAIANGTRTIVDTDDDNFPYQAFFQNRTRKVEAHYLKNMGRGVWANVYSYFTKAKIWPRGFPLNKIMDDIPAFETLSLSYIDCPIQQGLANENPDIDAIYRLLFPLPQNFRDDRRIAYSEGVWCPFNSQNTTWWPDTYPLLYLPSYCSFRMTDIWRSFVAQRIAWSNGWSILFHEPTVWQDRNKHDLMKDFADEIPGYLYNDRIKKVLEDLDIRPGADKLEDNLLTCYSALINLKVIEKDELPLLNTWLNDLAKIT